MLEALLDAGFNRVGIGESFIHVDIDGNKPSNTLWVY